jgi:hypothetical protein
MDAHRKIGGHDRNRSPGQSPRSGFEGGRWAMGVLDDESMTFIIQTCQSADAFLFGRRTYEASA